MVMLLRRRQRQLRVGSRIDCRGQGLRVAARRWNRLGVPVVSNVPGRRQVGDLAIARGGKVVRGRGQTGARVGESRGLLDSRGAEAQFVSVSQDLRRGGILGRAARGRGEAATIVGRGLARGVGIQQIGDRMAVIDACRKQTLHLREMQSLQERLPE